jgi:protein PhnA
MSTEKVLQDRSQQQCELCKVTQGLSIYEIPPHSTGGAEDSLYICEK